MPVLYKIDQDINVVYLAGFGYCTGTELVAADIDARNNSLRHANMAIIADLQAVAQLDVDAQDLRSAINRNRAPGAQGYVMEPTAVLIRGSLDQLITESYTIMAEPVTPISLAIFYSLDQALEWLGLADYAQAIAESRRALHDQYQSTLLQ